MHGENGKFHGGGSQGGKGPGKEHQNQPMLKNMGCGGGKGGSYACKDTDLGNCAIASLSLVEVFLSRNLETRIAL